MNSILGFMRLFMECAMKDLTLLVWLTQLGLSVALPLAGFILLALWLRKERNIRFVSLAGAPFWLAYNLYSAAYGSAIGNVITLVSISVAILRYDVCKTKRA